MRKAGRRWQAVRDRRALAGADAVGYAVVAIVPVDVARGPFTVPFRSTGTVSGRALVSGYRVLGGESLEAWGRGKGLEG